MLHKLRTRLILSHALLLVVLATLLVPIILYLLNSQYSLENRLEELERQADLIVEFGEGDPAIWQDVDSANALVQRISPYLDSRVMILDSRGNLLSSSLSTDEPRIGQYLNADVIQQAQQGKVGWEVDFNPFMQKRILDVAQPVFNARGEIIGILRFSYDIAELEQPVIPLRITVFVALFVGIITTLVLSFVLSRSLNSPLSRLTNAVMSLMSGSIQIKPVPETGPDEVRTVAISYNQLIKRLQQAERDRSLLLANIVHELGTPLGAIKSAIHALKSGAISDVQLARELLLGITGQLEQLGLLIDDLTLLGETEIRELIINRDWIDLTEMVRSECQTYKHLVADKQIQLVCQVVNEPIIVYADAIRVHQILANLLQNAYKYMATKGCINVSVERELLNGIPTNILIHVQDNGPGIPNDEQEAIFQPLYRSPRQRRLQQGMGIGLALARRLARAHGGELVVSSELGKGATFTLRLPAIQADI